MNNVHLKVRLVWSRTCLTIRNMPIIRGQILGRAWPVRSWWSPAASALPELSHCTRRYQVSFPRSDLLVERTGLSDFHLICALITGPMRAKDLQCVAVTFFFWKNLYFVISLFLKDLFPKYKNVGIIIPVLHQTFWNLWQERLWGSGFWYLIHWKKRYLLYAYFTLFWLDYIFVKRKKDMDWKQALTQMPSWSRGSSGNQLR